MTDELDFLAEDDEEETQEITEKVDVIIVDDEESVHQVTKLALSNHVVGNKALNFRDAYSGQEAMALLEEYQGFVLILLDVIMETDHAGLDVVTHIRERIKNDKAKIVLRTGQPGKFNEHDVMKQYAIDAFTDKASLTSEKLKAVVNEMIKIN